jgi:hypothetical protein
VKWFPMALALTLFCGPALVPAAEGVPHGFVNRVHKDADGHLRYTEYPHVGHNCWGKAYATPELWAWLLKQTRK